METTPIPASGSSALASPARSDGAIVEWKEGVASRRRVAVGTFELPPNRRLLSGPTMVALAVLAGIGSLALGSVAFVSSVRGGDDATAREPGIVAFLSRPATRRIPLDLPTGRIVLAVGSGRAYLVLGVLAPAQPGRSYQAWVSRSRTKARLAASFAGSEVVVPLAAKLTPGAVLSITMGAATANEGQPRMKNVIARATV